MGLLDTIGSWFSDAAPTAASVANEFGMNGVGDAVTVGGDMASGGGGGSSIWDSPGLWSTLINTGAGILGGEQQLGANDDALKAKQESDKFNYLVELAKLKYGKPSGGGKGGGGGSARNKNADLIDVLASGTDDRLKALGQLSSGITGALK